MNEELALLERKKFHAEIDRIQTETEKTKTETEKIKAETDDLKKSPWRRIGDWIKEVFSITVGLLALIFGALQTKEAIEVKKDAQAETKAAVADTNVAVAEKKKAEVDLNKIQSELVISSRDLEALKVKTAKELEDRRNQLDVKTAEITAKQAELEKTELNLAVATKDLELKTKDLADTQQKIVEIKNAAPAQQSEDLSKLATSVKKANARVIVEVVQNSVQLLPEPLRGYAVGVGSVGTSNAEKTVFFRVPEIVAKASNAELIEYRQNLQLADIVGAKDVKIHTGDKIDLPIGATGYQVTTSIINRRGKDSVQFIFEQK